MKLKKPSLGKLRHGIWAGIKKHPVALVSVVLIASAGLWLYSYSQGSSTATINNNSNAELQVQEETPEAPQQLQGKNFVLEYDGAYARVRSSDQDTSSIEQFVLNTSAQTTFSKQLSIVIKQLPSGGVAQESSYQFRSRPDSAYKQIEINSSLDAVVFAKEDNHEVAIFLTYKDKMATLVTTSSGTLDGKEEAAQLLEGFSWN